MDKKTKKLSYFLVLHFSLYYAILLETFVIGIPSFFLAFLPNDKPISGKFIYNLIRNALPGAITLILNIGAIFLFVQLTEGGLESYSDLVSTMCTITLTLTGLGLLLRLCKPWSAFTCVLFGSMSICCLLGIMLFPSFFFIGALNLTQKLFIVILAILSPTLINFIYKVFEKIKI